MDNNVLKYTTQAIDPAILSILDVTAEGKVVSVQDWVELWSLVINKINDINAHYSALDEASSAWEESTSALKKVVESFNIKYEALAKSFIHRGVTPPTNPDIRMWLMPVDSINEKSLMTRGEFISESVGKKTPNGGEVFNDYATNVASALHTHAEGKDTYAVGPFSHSQNYCTTAGGKASHAQNWFTKALHDFQTAIGMFNENKEDTLFEVGNGTSESNRSNAFEVYKDGHVEVQAQGYTDKSVVLIKTLKDYQPSCITAVDEDEGGTVLMPTMEATTAGGYSAIRVYDGIMGDIPIQGVADPTDDADAANKRYVDNAVASIPKSVGAVEVWDTDKQYTVGQVVVRNYINGTEFLRCKVEHTSSVENFEYEYSNYWESAGTIIAETANSAIYDAAGNDIIETYATKEEVGNINEALESVLNGGN